jgi:hypothetical protein
MGKPVSKFNVILYYRIRIKTETPLQSCSLIIIVESTVIE